MPVAAFDGGGDVVRQADLLRGLARMADDHVVAARALVAPRRLAREGELRLGRFFDLATDRLRLGKGETRMLAWTDQQLEGCRFDPEAGQTTFRTFVLVHLRPPRLGIPEQDKNHILDLAEDESASPVEVFPK